MSTSLITSAPSPQPAPAASPMLQRGPAPRDVEPEDLVRIDDKPQLWRVVDFHGPLVRLAPASPRTGRIVHPERLTRVEVAP